MTRWAACSAMPLLAWSPDTGTDLRRGKLSGGDPPDPVRGSVELPRHRRLPGRRWRLDRWRAVYRSDSLSFLTPGDLPAFDALGIKAIYDLRRSGEIAAHPGPHEYVHIELANRDPLEDGKSAGLVTRRDGERWLLADYRRMLASGAVTFGELFSRLAAPGRLPAVIHCLAGKDRTGLTVALLLTALGVPRLVVLDDYQLTNDYRGVAHSPQVVALFVQAGLARPAAEGLLGPPRWVLAQALGELDDTYDGIASYLLGPGGMRPAALAALRTALLRQDPTAAVP
jgi:protein-tyrosine phosphatase